MTYWRLGCPTIWFDGAATRRLTPRPSVVSGSRSTAYSLGSSRTMTTELAIGLDVELVYAGRHWPRSFSGVLGARVTTKLRRFSCGPRRATHWEWPYPPWARVENRTTSWRGLMIIIPRTVPVVQMAVAEPGLVWECPSNLSGGPPIAAADLRACHFPVCAWGTPVSFQNRQVGLACRKYPGKAFADRRRCWNAADLPQCLVDNHL
jgi:hypothetical protein